MSEKPTITSDEVVEHSEQSALSITRTVKIPKGAEVWGWGVGSTDVVECGECYALVTKEREYGHGLWHSEINRTAGQ